MSKKIYCLGSVLLAKKKKLSILNSEIIRFVKEIEHLKKLGNKGHSLTSKEDYEKRLQAKESEKKALEDVIGQCFAIEVIKAEMNECINGLLGMDRDVIMKLIRIIGNEFSEGEKIKTIIGIAKESMSWIELPIFKWAREIDINIVQKKIVEILYSAGSPAFSEPFRMFGKEWEVAITPDGDDYIGLHLDCLSFESPDLNKGEKVKIACQVFLLNDKNPLLRRGRGSICSFCENDDRFENMNFIPTKYLDEKHGYLKEETLHVEIVMISLGKKLLLEQKVNKDTSGRGVVLDESEGCVYHGHLKNGKKEGKGTLISRSRIYVGDWKDGKEHGMGEEIVYDNERGIVNANYQGQYSNGNWGSGTIIFPTGEQHEGKWENHYGLLYLNGTYFKASQSA